MRIVRRRDERVIHESLWLRPTNTGDWGQARMECGLIIARFGLVILWRDRRYGKDVKPR